MVKYFIFQSFSFFLFFPFTGKMSEYPKVPPYSPQAPPYQVGPPPPPGFQPGPPPPSFQPQPQPTIIHTTTIHQTAQFGETPKRMMCPNCRAEILTAVDSEFSVGQHIAFFVMCLTGICWICSCAPYCMDSLANVKHSCPQCHTHLGTFNRC